MPVGNEQPVDFPVLAFARADAIYWLPACKGLGDPAKGGIDFRERLGSFGAGENARSISTDSRGMSRTNRLMAVPPLSAKQLSLATIGRTRTSRRTCR
jgi:hypothetical protein